MIKTIIKNLTTSRGNYTVVWNDEHKAYFAINKNDIDENGRLTTEYNGIMGCANGNLSECIDERIKRDEIRTLIDNGLPFAEAFDKVYGLV